MQERKDAPATKKSRREDHHRRSDGVKQAAREGPKAATPAVDTAGKSGLPEKSKAPVSVHGLRRLIDAATRLFVLFGRQIVNALHPAANPLGRPGVQIVLVLVGATAGLSAAARFVAAGFDREGWFSVAVAVSALFFAALPHLLSPQRSRLADALRRLDAVGSRMVSSVAAAPSRIMRMAVLLGLAAGGAWLLWQWGPQLIGLSLSGGSGKIAEGPVIAVTGDTLRVGGTTVRLAGIEAPERDQYCTRPGNRRWRCGEAAAEALSQSVRGVRARCEIRGSDGGGRALGTCYARGKDVAAALVREGHVFSSSGWFASYGSLERQARAEQTGLWRGEAERPSEYRARIWQAAKRTAPRGCPIKGQVSAGGKTYVLPWSPDYPRIPVRTAKGERWFCSEQEAQTAGWKPAERR